MNEGIHSFIFCTGTCGGGWSAGAEFQAVFYFILFSSFPLLLAFVVGGLGFKFFVFVAGWRHALRSEWPFIIIINIVI